MEKEKKRDLRNGQPGVSINFDSMKEAGSESGHTVPDSHEHAVNPGVGSRAGVAEGQGTKSN